MTGATMGAMDYELEKAELRRRYPDWQIWYVPHVQGGLTWHARPRMEVSADTPGLLEAAIMAVSDSKGFDPEGDRPSRGSAPATWR